MRLSQTAITSARVALLVDGENISPEHAKYLLEVASQHGNPLIRRVYGMPERLAAWQAAEHLRPIASRPGKNGTDLLLSVEAMGFILRGQADVLVLATSDGDFTYLAENLRETGTTVAGLGDAKAPASLRHSCTTFTELPARPKPPAPIKSTAAPADALAQQVCALICTKGESGAIRIAQLGALMHAEYKANISTTPEKKWRAWLLKHPNLFALDPRGPDARVRLLKT